MVRATANRKTATSLFIEELLESATADQLISIGKAAQTVKSDEALSMLSTVGARLCLLSRKTYKVGLYYLALALNRSDAAGRAQARSIFERLAEEGSPLALRAALALGTTYGAVGEFEKAESLYAHILRAGADPELLFYISQNRAYIYGQERDHDRALTSLETALSLSRHILPAYQLYALNNTAVELLEVGKTDEADKVFTPVRFALNVNPEFKKTREDISRAVKAKVKSSSRVLLFPGVERHKNLDIETERKQQAYCEIYEYLWTDGEYRTDGEINTVADTVRMLKRAKR